MQEQKLSRPIMHNRKNRVHESRGDQVFDVITTIILILANLIIAYPLIYIVSASFSSADAVMAGRVWLFPVDFSLKARTAA